MKKITVLYEQLANCRDMELPKYMTAGASGVDFLAAVKSKVKIKPGDIVLIPTGLKVKIPDNYELQIRPRSGLALKYGITLLNTPGTIDSDYTGEIKIIVINLGKKNFFINRGDRIAQGILCKVEKINWKKAEAKEKLKFKNSKRNPQGFGTTGV